MSEGFDPDLAAADLVNLACAQAEAEGYSEIEVAAIRLKFLGDIPSIRKVIGEWWKQQGFDPTIQW